MLFSRPSRWILAFVCSSLIVAGCTTSTDTPQGETGSLSLDLVIGDGLVINEVHWTISGGDMADMDGTINTSAPESTASVEVFGLPPGEGYLVELEATDESKEITCRGSAEFDVTIGEATPVMVMLNCKKPARLGGVRVNGEFNICAELAKVVVSPLRTSVGYDIDLSAIGEDAEDDDLTYVWSADGGTIDDSNAEETTYTCGEAGRHEITIMVTDNDEYCTMATWTVPVTCVGGDNPCDDVVCQPDGNECTDEVCDPKDGVCESETVDDGTECDDGLGQCMDGECIDNDLCKDVDCDDDNECTNDICNPETGNCANPPVDDGTDCEGDGTCVDGSCIVDRCKGIICEPTLNDCTVNLCNTETGNCDETNVPDSTPCLDGAGACSNGECIEDNLCDDVDCTSDNDCVQDGNCDPADGNCIPGDDEPADTACTDGGVCDGAGACVECNDASQCSDDGNECTVAACESNQCGQNNVMDGDACDFMGGDGICEAGTCVEAPECNIDDDCDDQNDCTIHQCIGDVCVYEPLNGGSCDAGGIPGTCSNGSCVGLCDSADCTSSNECVEDGTCDDQTGDCILGDNKPEGTACSQDGGTQCDGAGNCVSAATACNDGDTQTQTVQIGCTNGVTDAQSPFPNEMSITVGEPVFANDTFTVDASGIGAFPKFFLDAAQSTVPGGVRSAIVEGFNATVEANNGSGSILLQADAAGITPGLVQFCQYPRSTVCTQNSDCIVPPCRVPVLVVDVPISEDCGGGGVCEGLGQGFADGPASQCNITDPPEFCVTSGLAIPIVAPGGPEVFTAGASGDVLFNWAVDPRTITCPDSVLSRCANNGGTIPDRSLALPPSIYGDPVGDPNSVGLNGIRLNVAGALFVALQCSAGQDGGTCDGGSDAGLGCASDADCPAGTCAGVGVDDDVIVDSDPASLPSCPIN